MPRDINGPLPMLRQMSKETVVGELFNVSDFGTKVSVR